METTTALVYTLPELKEHIGESAYERALDKLRERESMFFEYEDPFQWGDGNAHIQQILRLPIVIKGRVCIEELSDCPITCTIDWKQTSWELKDNVLSYLNDDTARKISRIMRGIGCDLHEFVSFGDGYYSRNSILEPHYRYRASRTKRIDAVISEVVEVIDGWLRDVEHFIAQDYASVIEYTDSEENILEVAEINEYKFNELGELL